MPLTLPENKQTGVLLGHVAEGLNRGERFYVPIKHTVVTGMTEYGKTTTMETLFHNMPKNVTCLVFLTKRGEKRFRSSDVYRVPPFFKPRYDWRYVRTLLESTMNEKLRFETPWIYRVCKLAKVEVRNRYLGEEEGIFIVRELLGRMEADPKAKDFDKNINTTLIAYMDEFLPVLKAQMSTFTRTLKLAPGLNVMDLTSWYSNDALQMVVIRACMEELLDHAENTVTGLPEAWKNLPQGKNTPVKLLFEKYIREGATNHNYLYIDAQDLGGVDKVHLRQCDVWILGHMKQADEVKRLIQQTIGAKIKPEVIQTLPLGHFIVAAEDKATKVYVWPPNIPETMSIGVAKGELKPEDVKITIEELQNAEQKAQTVIAEQKIESIEQPFIPNRMTSRELERLAAPVPHIEGVVPDYLEKRVEDLERRVEALSIRVDGIAKMFEKILERQLSIEQKMIVIPQISQSTSSEMTLSQGIVKVKVEPTLLKVKMTTDDIAGKIMFIAKEGFLNNWHTGKEIEEQLSAAHAWTPVPISMYKALENLIEKGYIGKRKTDRVKYKLSDFVTFEE